MKFEEAQQKFIQGWGVLGSSWGINKTMAQIHGALLISPKPMSTEELMELLGISRGNANMNIRALIDWNLIEKEFKIGERKEYFSAEKDLWEVTKNVVVERRKRELEPIKKILEQVSHLDKAKTDEEKEFLKMTKSLNEFSKKSDGMLQKLVKADKHWFFGSFLKLLK